MRNATLRMLATLLGVLGTLSAAGAAVLVTFWVLDQGPTAGLPSFLAALGFGLVALACMVGRRLLVIAARPG
jgi:hypothetical protein